MDMRVNQASNLFHKLFSKPLVNIKEVQIVVDLSLRAENTLAKIFAEKFIPKEAVKNQRVRLVIFDY